MLKLAPAIAIATLTLFATPAFACGWGYGYGASGCGCGCGGVMRLATPMPRRGPMAMRRPRRMATRPRRMATMTMITDITRAAVTPATVTAGDTPTMAMAMGLGGVGAMRLGGLARWLRLSGRSRCSLRECWTRGWNWTCRGNWACWVWRWTGWVWRWTGWVWRWTGWVWRWTGWVWRWTGIWAALNLALRPPLCSRPPCHRRRASAG